VTADNSVRYLLDAKGAGSRWSPAERGTRIENYNALDAAVAVIVVRAEAYESWSPFPDVDPRGRLGERAGSSYSWPGSLPGLAGRE
jgi:hypothetical protein